MSKKHYDKEITKNIKYFFLSIAGLIIFEALMLFHHFDYYALLNNQVIVNQTYQFYYYLDWFAIFIIGIITGLFLFPIPDLIKQKREAKEIEVLEETFEEKGR